MAKLRKLVGWLPAVGAMIFNGCVIGWLHWTKPQLLGPAVSGNVIAVGYTILFLLWWCLAPAATACVIGGVSQTSSAKPGRNFFSWSCAVVSACVCAGAAAPLPGRYLFQGAGGLSGRGRAGDRTGLSAAAGA